ncbi:histidine kinase [uncultured Aquimarina sp.]|uniref:sensor histidine kinase n=1 Tax=uncultured Aquimarina sp. TaxID=575652 RepID=UPI0026017BA2|nr:histidine kinase [uncultured Aquimarina sp.]
MKRLFFISVILLVSFNSFAQEILSQHFIDTISFKEPNRVYIDQIKYSIQQDTTLKGWTKYYTFKSYVHLFKRENDSALTNAHKAIEAYESFEYTHPGADGIVHKAYYIKGLREYFGKKPLSALKTLYRGLELTSKYPESPDKKSWKFYILDRISYIHIEVGDVNLALETRKKAAMDTIWMSHKFEKGNNESEIGSLYRDLKKYDSAKFYFKSALKTYRDTSLIDSDNYRNVNFLINQVIANTGIGDVALNQKQDDSAYNSYNESYNIFRTNNLAEANIDEKLKLSAQIDYGFILSHKDSIKQSNVVLKSVLDSLKSNYDYSRDEKRLLFRVQGILSRNFKKIDDPSSELIVQKELNNYLIRYHDNSITKQLQLYAAEFDLKEKDASISKLEELTQQQNTIVQQKNIINWVLIGLFISFLILGVVLFRQNKLNSKYKTAVLEQRLLRSQLNPHFLFNALSSIVNLSSNKSEKVIPYTLKLSSLLRSILENSREEFVSVEEEIQTIRDYLELQSNFSQKFSYDVEIDLDIDSDEMLIPPMFIQPFVENAIEHGISNIEKGQITLKLVKEKNENLLKCSVLDNGVGYTKRNTLKNNTTGYQSLSGTILEERFKIYSKSLKVNARFDIVDNDKPGALVVVYIPYVLE